MNAELRVIGFRLGLSSEANARFRERALRWITADAPRPLPSLSQAPSWVDLIHAPLDNLQSRYALPDAFRADIVAFLDALGVRARPPEAERPTRAPARPPSIRRTPTRARAAAPEQPTWRRPSSPGLPERFEAAELLGAGGMGEVYRVRDRRIGRHVALKVLRADWANDAEIQARFIHEAQLTAQLQHPGIVPVYDMLRLPDGRAAYLMPEVRGESLADRLDARPRGEATDPTPLHAWIETLRRACDAVGYAHTQGVIHRDLKPENIYVGDHGEVVVLDWGLARILSADGPLRADPRVARHAVDQSGQLHGTPGYMPPEQVRGDPAAQGPHTDVYALGAILYEILGDLPPHEDPEDPDEDRMFARVLAEPPTPLAEGPASPGALIDIAMRALAREPADRYADAVALGAELAMWLEGAARRERALELLAQTLDKRANADRLRQRAESVRAAGRRALLLHRDRDPTRALVDRDRAEAEADRLEQGADVIETVALQLAHAARAQDATLAEADEVLAEMYAAELQRAEALHDHRGASRARLLLSSHDQGRRARWLAGDGTLSLVTSPPDAEVTLQRVSAKAGVLLPEPKGLSLVAPVVDQPVAMGSWLLTLRAPDHHELQIPVHIGRAQRWESRLPDADHPHPLRLLQRGELRDDERYVPAGEVTVGDPREPRAAPAHRVWVPGFVMRQHPVTQEEYLEFIEHLRRSGHEVEAAQRAPRTPDSLVTPGQIAWRLRPDGAWRLPSAWFPDAPVVLIDQSSACAYARWRALRDGLPWRLPHEFEWEKAARGPDGRRYPWGDGAPHVHACTWTSGFDRPARCEEQASDRSPYGVEGLGGNVREWCINAFVPNGLLPLDPVLPAPTPDPSVTVAAVRGGSWKMEPERAASALRGAMRATDRAEDLGFRLVRAVPGG